MLCKDGTNFVKEKNFVDVDEKYEQMRCLLLDTWNIYKILTRGSSNVRNCLRTHSDKSN